MAASMRQTCLLFRKHNFKHYISDVKKISVGSILHHKLHKNYYSFSANNLHEHNNILKYYGQPAPHTHPNKLKHDEVTPYLTKQEYEYRRNSLVNLCKNSINEQNSRSPVDCHLIILTSASKVYMSPKIMYPFRQSTDFNYFTGFLESDSILLIKADKHDLSSTLFVTTCDPKMELWDGPSAGLDGAIHLTGIDKSEKVSHISQYLSDDVIGKYKTCLLWYDWMQPTHIQHHEVIVPILKSFQEKGSLVQIPTNIMHTLRCRKSSAEIELMKKTAQIASESFVEVMKFSYPGVDESQLYAKVDYECRLRGASMLGYVPVVAGGNRANTIHYIKNDQVVDDGDLVLMDAGCDYNGYQSDVTRTWPVSGVFTAPQRVVYDAVLRVQLACIKMCRPGTCITNIYNAMVTLFVSELINMGVIPNSMEKEDATMMVTKYCPHNVGHYLGMDIHDTNTVSCNAKLEPGMVITIEPGLYFPAQDGSIPQKFRGMGIRIEDNILITNSEPVILTENCPKDPDLIEEIMANRTRDSYF